MDYLGFGYAAIIAFGGIFGFIKAGSLMSLGSGLLFGALSAYGAYQLSQNENDYMLLLCTSGFLAAMMGYRAANSGKFMPSGLVAILSVLMVIRLVIRMLKWFATSWRLHPATFECCYVHARKRLCVFVYVAVCVSAYVWNTPLSLSFCVCVCAFVCSCMVTVTRYGLNVCYRYHSMLY